MSQMGRLHYLFTQFSRLVSEALTSETSKTLATTDDYTTNPYVFKAAPGAGFSFYVTRIVFAVTTADKTKSIQILAGSTVIATILGTQDPTAANSVVGVAPIVDFGPDGFKCPANQPLQLKNSATGLAGSIFVMGYSRQNPST